MNTPERSNGIGTRSTSYESATTSIALARNDVSEWLSARNVDDSIGERAVLAISELVTNAVQASAEPFEMAMIEVSPDVIRLEVTNQARAHAIPPRSEWGPDEVLSPRGRGLAIAESVSDRMQILEVPGTVTARVEFDLAG